MKTLALVAALVMSGCYGAQLRSMETKLGSLEQENQSLRRQNAQLRQSPSDEGARDVLSVVQADPMPAPMPMPLPGSSVSSLIEQVPEGYHCFVGDPTIGGGNVVKLVNEHDRFWVQMTMNGKPVIVMHGSSPVLARADVSVLAPGSACYVPVGSRMMGRKFRNFALTAVAYTEAHGSIDPLRPLLDSQPASYLEKPREFHLLSDRVTPATLQWWMWQ